MALRARIVLLSASGKPNSAICEQLRCSMPTVGKWRERFRVHRLEGLVDEPRPGAPRRATDNIPGTGRITVAADKGYDDATFVEACRMRNVTPHVAQNLARKGGSAIDERTTQTPGYQFSQRVRKQIAEIFGWLKTVGGFRRTRFRRRARTQMAAYIAGAAYNLSRMERLGAAGP